MKQIRDAVPVPLVLHGGSGTPEDQIKKAVTFGIAKVNVASEIAKAFNASYISTMTEGKTWWTLAKKSATAKTVDVIGRWMDMLDSTGKA